MRFFLAAARASTSSLFSTCAMTTFLFRHDHTPSLAVV
jgi:hypothetical protein